MVRFAFPVFQKRFDATVIQARLVTHFEGFDLQRPPAGFVFRIEQGRSQQIVQDFPKACLSTGFRVSSNVIVVLMLMMS